jgi:dienelactone hydrolase
MQSDVGVYQDLMEQVLAQQEARLSFLAREWPEVNQWRTEARGKLLELLAFRPEPAPLDVRPVRRIERDGVEIEEVSWEVGYGPRAHAWVLKPVAAAGRLPAVVALHDHGGFKYYGKEKIALTDHVFPLTAEHIDVAYGGVPWANALAKEGFLVLAHDTFAFGSRAVPVESLSDRYRRRFRELTPGTPAYVRAYNGFAGEHEHLLAKSFFTAGTTWPGVYAFEDRRAVDYLLTRADVEPARIGCAGLSGGGLRSVLLAGTDERIRATVCVGFMSTWRGLLQDRIAMHTWMLYIPHAARYFDFPDILSLTAPNAALVQYGEEDPLYTPAGQRDADRRLREVYARLGAAERFTGTFYPGEHRFDVPMQREAFAFLRANL